MYDMWRGIWQGMTYDMTTQLTMYVDYTVSLEMYMT